MKPGIADSNHRPARLRLRRTVNNTPPKLAAPAVKQAVKRWLFRERITYAQAIVRLRERFGISVSSGTVSRFWHRCSDPAPPQDIVLLDAVLQSEMPLRVVIREVRGLLRVKLSNPKPQ